MNIKILKNINTIKFPKPIVFDDFILIFGIKPEKDIEKNVNKFVVYFEKYTKSFDFLEEVSINYNFNQSTLIWDIKVKKDYFIFLIEQKTISTNKHGCIFYNYYIKKKYILDFKPYKIEKINLENHLIFKINNGITFSSKIEKDEERPDFFWGKYLFYFKDISNNFYQPVFDFYVDFKRDKGHLLHFIEKKKEEWIIIFSIRHVSQENKEKYYYKIYSSKSKDLKYFYNTEPISIDNNITNTEWYCYPAILKVSEKYFILLNQDDFGKEKNTLVGELHF